jgi:hypothetical protein
MDLQGKERAIIATAERFLEGTKKAMRGQHSLYVAGLSPTQDTALVLIGFTFTLYESDVEELNRIPGFFGHGFSAQMPAASGPNAPREVSARLAPIADAKALKSGFEGARRKLAR